jgi:hypothetical protein
MRNADLLSPASGTKRRKHNCNVGSEPPSFFWKNENSLLSALRNGTIELNSFIENGYHQLKPGERMKAFEIISNASYVKKHSIDYPLLKARFNPKNQYRVKTFNLVVEHIYECFMFEGKFHTGAQLFLKESYITEVVRIASQDWVKCNA